jgi:hypothetical protein
LKPFEEEQLHELLTEIRTLSAQPL